LYVVFNAVDFGIYVLSVRLYMVSVYCCSFFIRYEI